MASPEVGADGGDDAGSPPLRLGDVGRLPLRRLTNLEYDNTVRDLLGVEGPARKTFEDDPTSTGTLSHGLDVSADSFDFNQARAEQDLLTAEALADEVFADDLLRARVVTCHPGDPTDDTCARHIVIVFGQRAWRRPLTADEVNGLVALAAAAQTDGATFDDAMKTVVTALLTSAPFLMRIELDPDPMSLASHEVAPYELASRLSYLLWSSMPDDRLFTLAADGSLARADVLRGEVGRMLQDTRADGFVDGFGLNWLGVSQLPAKQFDPTVTPTWSKALAAAAVEETRRYLGEFLRNDLSFATFPSADFNYVNGALARLYDLPVRAPEDSFVRYVDLTDHREGVLGLAATLALTSRAQRTSPTERGQWILDRLLCVTAPPEPPGTPDHIFETTDMSPAALHTSIATQSSCWGCHSLMDGLGQALEDFDQIGAFRGQYADGSPVDSDGFVNGQGIEGEKALAENLATDARVLACVARKVLSFALNRELGTADDAYATQIQVDWQTQTPTLRRLLEEIVVSDVFRYRRGEGAL